MTLTQLLYFLETSRREHIGKTAEILCISPSAISHSIASLEQEFGKKLFMKKGKSIQLTNFGKIMAERAAYLLETAEKIKSELLTGEIELQRHYTLAATHILCEYFLTVAWMDIQKSYTHLTGDIYSLRSADVVQKTSDGEIDFGLCFSPQASPTFEEQIIYEGQLVLAVHSTHPISGYSIPDQISALSEYPALLPKLFHGITNCQSHPIFKTLNINPKEKILFDNYSVALKALEYSNSWSLIPDIILKFSPELFTIIKPENWDVPVKISAIWPKNRLMTGVISHLIKSLQNLFSIL